MGFLAGGIRTAVAGGWRRRCEPENADRWFFVLWALFIFLFFSKSQSKLAPYILPIFPPLAVLIGAVVGPAWRDRTMAGVKMGGRIFAVSCAVMALAVMAAVSMPDRFQIDPFQALTLRPYARALFAILDAGALVMLWASGRNGQARRALGVLMATTVLFLMAVTLAEPLLYTDTKDLALWVRDHGRPDDRIYAYAGFFQDFMYYSGRLEDTVGYHGDEIELENDPVARASGRFVEKQQFLRTWEGPGRVLVVARRSEAETAALLTDPGFHYSLLASNPDFYLLANRQ
jgi:4-amino-4-deoxy-L-arabinose transferase-like glycosyltransferase